MGGKDKFEKWMNNRRPFKCGSVFGTEKALYSYGYNFPLMVTCQDGKMLCNADRYSNTTSKHQSWLFDSNLPHVPFSALRQAYPEIHARIYQRYYEEYFQNIEILDNIEDTQFYDENLKKWNHTPGAVLLKTPSEDRESGYKYLLCGMDDGHYFVCELPKEVNTISEAFDSLKPDIVREKETAGIQVLRQGDIYFLRTSILVKDFKKTIKKELANNPNKFYGGLNRRDSLCLDGLGPFYINDTHYTKEGVFVKELDYSTDSFYRETNLVWGIVKHLRGEHKQVKLRLNDEEKNGTYVYQAIPNLKVEAWATGGNVD